MGKNKLERKSRKTYCGNGYTVNAVLINIFSEKSSRKYFSGSKTRRDRNAAGARTWVWNRFSRVFFDFSFYFFIKIIIKKSEELDYINKNRNGAL